MDDVELSNVARLLADGVVDLPTILKMRDVLRLADDKGIGSEDSFLSELLRYAARNAAVGDENSHHAALCSLRATTRPTDIPALEILFGVDGFSECAIPPIRHCINAVEN